MAVDVQEAPRPLKDADDKTRQLLQIVTALARELRRQERQPTRVTLDSALERDLGFDSLSRVELLTRIERAFGISVSEQAFTAAETPRDLLRLVTGATAMPAAAAMPESKLISLEEAPPAPAQAQTLPDMLEWHVQTHPDRPHVYLVSDQSREEEITYGALLRGAEAVAVGLQQAGLEPGNSVAIMLPTSREYLFTFFGILLAGGIPVPIYPPVRLAQIEEHLRRHVGILTNAQVPILVTVSEAKPLARLLKTHVECLRHVTTVDELVSTVGALTRPVLKSDDTAFLQYTSGSTAAPKGVVLTHRNLLANIRIMGAELEVDSTDVFVSWLPMYHDMGLIGAWLGSMYFAVPLVLMSPLSFLTRPARWLWAIHRYRATLSAAPNFAYELCRGKIDDQDIQGLDLQSWRMAFNAAEPVSPETVRGFTERFARYGFRPEAMFVGYGLAECSVGLAFPPLERGPLIDRVKRQRFMRDGQAIPAAEDETHALRFVSCGYPLAEHEIRIVDATGSEVGDRQEGRLQFRGPSATSGYFRNPEATRRLFNGDWLDSGDLAYTVDGEIYITGRAKDMIIRAGRNIYPPELEEAVGSIPGIRRGCVAAFPVTDPGTGTERLLILAETRETEAGVLDTLRKQINSVIVDLIGMPPDDVVLAPPRTVLKTSSGKLRRAASRELYESGRLDARKHGAWWQLAHFAWTGLLPQLHRLKRLVGELIYAGYVWILFILVAPLTWLSITLLPRASWSWAVLRAAGRLLLWLSATRLRVEGLSNIPRAEPFVLVANHSSYLDGLVLSVVLPRPVSYVAKRELEDRFISRVFLRRIGVEYVERFDKQRGVDDARRTARALDQGRALAFFAEGTFLRMPGVLPFRMGAFVAAAEASVPIVPVTIRGTRAKLRSNQWLPRRGAVSVTISAPIRPQGRDWSAAVALRDTARAEILRRSGEPDLGQVTSST
ncbi:MAG: AMP-binding protein [Gammaproteobacteria bacterium]|nr:AMP-binding protein [Gammaproteobacteria bacterium]